MNSDDDLGRIGCGCLVIILLYAFAIGWAVLWWKIGELALADVSGAALFCFVPILAIWCAGPFVSITGKLLE